MSKTHAFGTVFKWNGIPVAGLNSINGIDISVDQIDITTHDSTGGYKEYMSGLMDTGDVPISGYFDSSDTTGQLTMLTDMNAKTTRECIIQFPVSTGTIWTFNGLITSMKIGDSSVDGAIPFTATIKPTGQPVLTVAVSAGMSAMALSGAAVLSPVFAIGTTDYVATVLTGVASLTVTPTAALGVITVNGTVVTSGQASGTINLGAAGSVTIITVVVKEALKASKTYTIRVARP